MENEEFIREFLEESEENLDQLDQDFVSLEQDPRDLNRLDNIYRAIHTIKGTCGFFGFSKLGAVAHSAENLLSRLRDGELTLNKGLASALLDSVDAIRDILTHIGRDGGEGDGNYRELNQKLDSLSSSPAITEPDSELAEASHLGALTANLGPSEATSIAVAKDYSDHAAAQNNIRNHLTGQDGELTQPRVQEPTDNRNLRREQLQKTAHHADPVENLLNVLENSISHPVAAREHVASSPHAATTNSTPVPPEDTCTPQVIGSAGSIRVDVGLLNELMDLVGELVLARNQLVQTETNEHDHRLTDVTQQVNRITTELQERVMQTRMQPIGTIWGKFPRLVRDLAVMCGKEVDLVMHGSETEVDKSLLEAIKDPLTHLIRNAIDHGLETGDNRISVGKTKRGQVYLHAWHQGGKVNIEISDNGQGIDPAKIREQAISKSLISANEARAMDDQQLVQLIFWPGFSTAQEVTGISGRGVGMDVVKTNIESIGGTIDVQSEIGVRTSITVRIPLTLAIVPALVICCSEQLFAIPQSHLVEMLRVDLNNARDRIEYLRDTAVYRLRGELLPIVYLSNLLGLTAIAPEREGDHVNIVVLQSDNCRFGLVVDHVERMEEIVVKALHPSLDSIPYLAGATVMGNGRVALILDVLGLATDIGLKLEDQKQASQLIEQPTLEQVADQMLIFRLASGRELALPLSEIDRLEDIPAARIQQTDQMQAVKYRGDIMPLLPLSRLLSEATPNDHKPHPTHLTDGQQVKAIVIDTNGCRTAIAVREIVDVAAQQGPMRFTNSPGSVISGAAMLDGKVTDVLDLAAVLQRSGFDQHTHMRASI